MNKRFPGKAFVKALSGILCTFVNISILLYVMWKPLIMRGFPSHNSEKERPFDRKDALLSTDPEPLLFGRPSAVTELPAERWCRICSRVRDTLFRISYMLSHKRTAKRTLLFHDCIIPRGSCISDGRTSAAGRYMLLRQRSRRFAGPCLSSCRAGPYRCRYRRRYGHTDRYWHRR